MLKRARKRGITVCKRWLRFENFHNDMGHPPKNHVLDRLRNSKGYSPSNCRWATYYQSTENRRVTRWVRLGKQRIRVSDAARRLKIPAARIYLRMYRGWSTRQLWNSRKLNGFDRYGRTGKERQPQ